MNYFKTAFLISILLLCIDLRAQMPDLSTKRVYTTRSVSESESPEIDGLINEPAWEKVEWTSDYIENQPDENTPPSEQTKFKVIYDKKYLYFAFRCYDKDPQGIVKRMSRAMVLKAILSKSISTVTMINAQGFLLPLQFLG